MWLVFRYALAAVRAVARERRELALENIALRHLWGAIIPNEANPDSDHSGSNIVALQGNRRFQRGGRRRCGWSSDMRSRR